MHVFHQAIKAAILVCVTACCSSPAAFPPANSSSSEPAPAAAESRNGTGIVITTGVHGNEPSGYLVQDELVAMGFIVFGPCNPWGIANGKRHLEDGRDLNRCFALDDCPEAEAVREFLRDNKPKLLLDLHEDPDGSGPYLIQNGPTDDIGRRIIDRLKGEFEFDPAPEWSFIKGEDGLIKPTRGMLGMQKLTKVYSLGYYTWLTYGCTAITVECPGTWPEDKRKRYQLRVCEVARELFSETK